MRKKENWFQNLLSNGSTCNRCAEAWNRGDMDQGLEALVKQTQDRRDILTANYGSYWENL